MGSDTPTPPRRSLSVLIPFFNEAGNIQPLVDEVHAALAGIDYEIVCVNDASSDSTAAELVVAQQLARLQEHMQLRKRLDLGGADPARAARALPHL